jgi:hypothetical protein
MNPQCPAADRLMGGRWRKRESEWLFKNNPSLYAFPWLLLHDSSAVRLAQAIILGIRGRAIASNAG